MRRRFWLSCGLLMTGVFATLAVAQRENGQPARKSDAKRNVVAKGSTAPGTAPQKQQPMALTEARKAAALTFASVHHPELAELLRRLEKRNKAAYRRAVRQLYLDSERLARIKERSPARYELELKLWKADSRIRLLAARVATSKRPDPKLEEQLKEALRERVELRIGQLEIEKQRLESRLRKLEEEISSLRDKPDVALEKYLQRVKRGLGIRKRTNRKASPKTKRRPSRKTTSRKTDNGDSNP